MLKKISLVIILFSLPTTVFPHSPLKLAYPMDGASLTEAPTEYKMLFKSPAKLIRFEIFQKVQNNKKKSSSLKGLFKKQGYEINWKEIEKQSLDQTINTLSMASPFSLEEKQVLLETKELNLRKKKLEEILNTYVLDNFNNKTLQ